LGESDKERKNEMVVTADELRLRAAADGAIRTLLKALENAIVAVDAAGEYGEVEHLALRACVAAFEMEGNSDIDLPEWVKPL
jgi:predicted amidohydrolase YtcJ